jgi:hypothetical protein
MKQIAAFLERVLRGNNKPYLLKISGGLCKVGNDQMARVDRIERAKKQSNLQD